MALFWASTAPDFDFDADPNSLIFYSIADLDPASQK